MCQIYLKTNTMNFIKIQYSYLKTRGMCEGEFIRHAEEDGHNKAPTLCKATINVRREFPSADPDAICFPVVKGHPLA